MKKISANQEINAEFQIVRYQNGIRLVRPENASQISCGSIKKVMNLPLSAYFLDRNSQCRYYNPTMATYLNAENLTDYIGIDATVAFKSESAKKIIFNDQHVMKYQQLMIAEEGGRLKNNNEIIGLSIKLPWYDRENKIIGIFGITIPSDYSISEALTTIVHTGLLNQPPLLSMPGALLDQAYYTKHELDVLRHTLLGKSAFATGKALHISARTVEYHLQNLKIKLNVQTKADLIAKIMQTIL